MLEIVIAALAGVLTVASPCILPMLPIVFGASVGQASRWRPLFITLGFVLSFAAVSLVLTAFGEAFGISPNALHNGAIVLLAILGVLMLFPSVFEKMTNKLSGLFTRAGAIGDRAGPSNWGGLVLGLTLGVVWTPCAGPVLASILTLIASTHNLPRATIMLIAYALGAGVPMLAIAYGGQYLTTRVRKLVKYTPLLQKIFGVIILALAAAMYFQYDLVIEAWLAQFYPTISKGM